MVVGREGSDEMEAVTYEELEMLVNRVANGLAAAGFAPGDAIALYMPMNLECVAAYLGIIRAGCAVVSIADSFAAPEIARRLEISEAAAIITVSSFQRGGRSIALYETVLRSRCHPSHRDRRRGILTASTCATAIFCGGISSAIRPSFEARHRPTPTPSPTSSSPPAPPAIPRPSRGPT